MTEIKASMWKPDPLADAEFKLAISQVLHRQAGIRGFFCSPKKGEGGYRAEIGQHTWEGRPAFSGLFRPDVALGTGRTPLIAAMNGYRNAGLDDPMMRAIYLEIETHYLGRAVKTIGRLETALEGLTGLLCSVNVPAPYDEDDDL